MTDYRDAVITELADSECELRARVTTLEAERDTYRSMLSLTLDKLHGALERERRQREAYARLLTELQQTRRSHPRKAA